MRASGRWLLHHARDTRQQPAATEGRDDGVDVRQVFEDLETDRAVAADEVIVVEGMDEVSLHAIGAMLLDRAPALVEGRLHDRRAEPLDGAQLGLGRRVHHQDAAAGADLSRRERDALRGVPGTDRPHAVCEFGRRQLAHGVVGATDLEGSDRLQRFELEKHFGLSRCRRQRHERRAYGRLVDARGRVTNGVDGDASGHCVRL